MSSTAPTGKSSNPVFAGNRLKLGLFSTNGRGASQSLVPEAHTTSWEFALRTARSADRAGYEAIVPYARWKGYPQGNPAHLSGNVMDSFTWAAGIAQATTHAGVFATSHAPTMHPIVAAKQAATIDLISHGRFAMNVVGGWNAPEMEMFGAPLREHDQRYEYLAEWLEIIRKLWVETEEFDHSGEFFKVIRGSSLPKPMQRPGPPIMNAGGSPRGRRFAAQHADLCFVVLTSEDVDGIRRQVDSYKRLAEEEFGRTVQVWTHTYVVQRDTRKEADAYLHRFAVEYEDVESVDAWMKLQAEQAQLLPPEALAAFRLRFAAGAGGFPLVGTAEHITDRLALLAEGGIDGVLLTWVDYYDGIERFNADVLPALEKLGLRDPFTPANGSPG
jgi:alkanesulfonate monooxygenase SsuD/methylene tetrahydromethanopterin reductase-like flavin-dependent oxidoreductase (luciferase family)